MQRDHELAVIRHARAELARLTHILLDAVSIRVASDAPLALECDAAFLENVLTYVELVSRHLEVCGVEAHDTDRPPPPTWTPHSSHDVPAPGCVECVEATERCLVCGHFHGGQGNCVTAHAFVAREDCATCAAELHP